MYNTPGGNYYYQPQVSFDWISEAFKRFQEKSGLWILVSIFLGFIWCSFEVLLLAITGHLSVFATIINNTSNLQYVRQLVDNIGFFPRMGYAFGITFLSYLVNVFAFNVALRQVRGKNVEFADLFDVGRIIGSMAGVSFLLALISTIVNNLCCLGFFLMPLFMFAPLYVLDHNNPSEALGNSFKALQNQYFMALIFSIVINLLDSSGLLLCCVGLLVTYPVYILSIAIGYNQFNSPVQSYPGYGQPQAGAWPPPPGSTPYNQQPPYGQPQYPSQLPPYGHPPVPPAPPYGQQPPVPSAPPYGQQPPVPSAPPYGQPPSVQPQPPYGQPPSVQPQPPYGQQEPMQPQPPATPPPPAQPVDQPPQAVSPPDPFGLQADPFGQTPSVEDKTKDGSDGNSNTPS